MEKPYVLVEAIAHEAEGIKSFTLAAASGGQLPYYTPSAHIDVHMCPGLTRQ